MKKVKNKCLNKKGEDIKKQENKKSKISMYGRILDLVELEERRKRKEKMLETIIEKKKEGEQQQEQQKNHTEEEEKKAKREEKNSFVEIGKNCDNNITLEKTKDIDDDFKKQYLTNETVPIEEQAEIDYDKLEKEEESRIILPHQVW
jgi:hypothetical protein